MQALPFSREEQYKLLEEDKVAEVVREFLNGDVSRIGEVITLTQEEYAAWDLTKPLRDDGWIRKSPSTQDGVYFIKHSDSWWTVYQQDRGAMVWEKSFSTYDDVRRYLAIDYGLGRYLRSEQAEKNNMGKPAEGPQLNASPKSGGEGKAMKKWWQFW